MKICLRTDSDTVLSEHTLLLAFQYHDFHLVRVHRKRNPTKTSNIKKQGGGGMKNDDPIQIWRMTDWTEMVFQHCLNSSIACGT